MVSFAKATVSQILNTYDDLQEVAVARDDDGPGNRAYVQTKLIGAVAVGDQVILNTSAVELSLGTGGWHFVHWNLSRSEFRNASGGHAMKLRYTSLQHDVDAIEESTEAPIPPDTLDGTPVICAPLLSQAAIAAVAAKSRRPAAKIALVVSDQTALSIAISHVVRDLKTKGVIEGVITCGQAFGGDFEATTFASAVLHARSALKADLVIASQGPGSLGTASRYGFSILETARMLDDVAFLDGVPIFCVRWSSADRRDRHRGLSHHSRTILERTSRSIVPIPDGFSAIDISGHESVFCDVTDVAQILEQHQMNVTTMGRSISEDPGFFQFAAAAGAYGAQRLQSP